MEYLRDAVLATIAYYDIIDYPLTPIQTRSFLINPASLFPDVPGIGKISIADVYQSLGQLVSEGMIRESLGFYALAERDDSFFIRRIEREKIASQKWKRLLRYARWFQAVPYIREIFVSGSLALSWAHEKSDYDVLVIVRDGRLYTSRLLLSLLASLLRVRRKRNDRIAPDTFCFNHYRTTQALHIPYESMYAAHIYSQLIPLLGNKEIQEAFFAANAWLHTFLYHGRLNPASIRSLRPSTFLRICASFGETIFNTWLGDLLERLAQRYQQRRIAHNPVTYDPGGRVIFTRSELEFHPKSVEGSILDAYHKKLSELRLDHSMPTLMETY